MKIRIIERRFAILFILGHLYICISIEFSGLDCK